MVAQAERRWSTLLGALVARGACTHGFMSSRPRTNALFTTPVLQLAIDSDDADLVMHVLEHGPAMSCKGLGRALQQVKTARRAEIVTLLRTCMARQAAHQALGETVRPGTLQR